MKITLKIYLDNKSTKNITATNLSGTSVTTTLKSRGGIINDKNGNPISRGNIGSTDYREPDIATNLSRKNIIKIPILISGQLRQHKLVNIIIIEIKLDIGNTII